MITLQQKRLSQFGAAKSKTQKKKKKKINKKKGGRWIIKTHQKGKNKASLNSEVNTKIQQSSTRKPVYFLIKQISQRTQNIYSPHYYPANTNNECAWTRYHNKRVSDKALFHLQCVWPAFILPALIANRQWLPISLQRERGWSWRKELSTPIRSAAGGRLSKARSLLGRKHPKLQSQNTEKQSERWRRQQERLGLKRLSPSSTNWQEVKKIYIYFLIVCLLVYVTPTKLQTLSDLWCVFFFFFIPWMDANHANYTCAE